MLRETERKIAKDITQKATSRVHLGEKLSINLSWRGNDVWQKNTRKTTCLEPHWQLCRAPDNVSTQNTDVPCTSVTDLSRGNTYRAGVEKVTVKEQISQSLELTALWCNMCIAVWKSGTNFMGSSSIASSFTQKPNSRLFLNHRQSSFVVT